MKPYLPDELAHALHEVLGPPLHAPAADVVLPAGQMDPDSIAFMKSRPPMPAVAPTPAQRKETYRRIS